MVLLLPRSIDERPLLDSTSSRKKSTATPGEAPARRSLGARRRQGGEGSHRDSWNQCLSRRLKRARNRAACTADAVGGVRRVLGRRDLPFLSGMLPVVNGRSPLQAASRETLVGISGMRRSACWRRLPGRGRRRRDSVRSTARGNGVRVHHRGCRVVSSRQGRRCVRDGARPVRERGRGICTAVRIVRLV